MFKLPDLPYDYSGLEPHIDEETMKIHHTKHHSGYVDKLNKALEGYPEIAKKSIEEILGDLDSLPGDIKTAVINNGGGHFNHSLFWSIMKPEGSSPEGRIARMIDDSFGSFESFKEEFGREAAGCFGSGWVWLIAGDKLSIASTANQDSPISAGQKPILGLDVWEHAYYLKYQNRRPAYIEAWFKVINWSEVANRL